MVSPNHDARVGSVRHLVLHYTGMRTGAEALARLCDPVARVSSHYVVEEDGCVFRLVPEGRRAWHAGVSYWRGETGLNDSSVGIEIVNPGHEWGYRAFPVLQLAAVLELCLEVIGRHGIGAANVVGHSDIAPTRKQDPGELFPWAEFAAEGVGVFPAGDGVGDDGDAAALLSAIGYDVADLTAAVTAFQRRYRPEAVTGVRDPESLTLMAEVKRLIGQ
ncbi:N-acetylmuramoyl-L-alanine amidase [Roseomonas arctica]|uniref:N-acetylmuramoyl-L-alanine amidase n=1 Tax=Plastoroseomonas arctica TaxID=1509237 RepID=A0AAF1JXG9_9PROT|nr:N-acetylmuramoyl-L-alanine amidase [Plastoroseomonas arctica]